MDFDIQAFFDDATIPYKREYMPFRMPTHYTGYLSSSFPDYVTSVENVPSSLKIRVLLRSNKIPEGDGYLIAEVTSGQDGSWYVGGLDPSKKYDVVCRCAGYNDLILTNISPMV